MRRRSSDRSRERSERILRMRGDEETFKRNSVALIARIALDPARPRASLPSVVPLYKDRQESTMISVRENDLYLGTPTRRLSYSRGASRRHRNKRKRKKRTHARQFYYHTHGLRFEFACLFGYGSVALTRLRSKLAIDLAHDHC